MSSFNFPLIVLNFADPLTVAQQERIVALIGRSIDRLIEVPCQIDLQKPLSFQVVDLVNELGMTYTEWNISEIFVNLPNDSVVAAVLIAEIHGRMGYFPHVLRLFPAYEIINLWAQSDNAKYRR